MPIAIINWVAVVVAALVSMVIGAVWYAPQIFGKKWMHLIHKESKDLRKGAGQAYAATALLALITAYVLAHIVSFMNAVTAWEGVQAGFWVWMGFVATSSLSSYIFERRSKKLWLINYSYHFVALVVMGAILAAWPI